MGWVLCSTSILWEVWRRNTSRDLIFELYEPNLGNCSRPWDNQTLDCTTFFWKALLWMVMICACFRPRHSPYYDHLCRASDIIGMLWTTFNVFGYDAVLGPRFESFTFPTTSRCAFWYATDAGSFKGNGHIIHTF